MFDRTLEFRAIVASRRAQHQQPPVAPPPTTIKAAPSGFAAQASAIGGEIHATAGKLSKLTQLAQSKSLFEDPTIEINELTHIIKQDITALNAKLAELQKAAAAARADAAASKQRVAHSASVVETLKTKLYDATREFQDVLQTRSHNIQLLQGRRELLSASAAVGESSGGGGDGGGGSSTPGSGAFGGGGSFGGGGAAAGGGNVTPQPNQPLLRSRFAPPAAIFELAPPPAESSGDGSGGGKYKKDDDFGGGGSFGGSGGACEGAAWATPGSKPAGMSHGGGGEVIIDMDAAMGSAQMQTQQMMPSNYLDTRAQAVDSVHSTLNELGGIFQNLAAMVASQENALQRIDENLDTSLTNFREGHAQLQRYWRGMSSNQGLIMRIFAVLMFFVIVWGTFFA